jgi:D-beta-D-heptose 7-phosphate kinase/D-beta-D-heptose 1-phosphate adenosyltransferase
MKEKCILVIGDIMLDQYIHGEVKRISPEAPVPVLSVRDTTCCLGGCGNVAANIVSLGGQAEVSSVVGSDIEAGMVVSGLQDSGISTKGLVYDVLRPTTTKTRLVSGGQHITRIDRECTAPIPSWVSQAMMNYIESLPLPDAVVFSDYSKGVLTSIFSEHLMHYFATVPTIVDSKASDLTKYAGATIITPNEREATRAAGFAFDEPVTIEEVGRTLLRRYQPQAVLLTRGKDGMLLFEEDNITPFGSNAKEVYDVVGAGDTAVAALAVAIAENQPIQSAVAYANLAAGVVVGKAGTALLTRAELSETG